MLGEPDTGLVGNPLKVHVPSGVRCRDGEQDESNDAVRSRASKLPSVLNYACNVLRDWARPVRNSWKTPVCVRSLELKKEGLSTHGEPDICPLAAAVRGLKGDGASTFCHQVSRKLELEPSLELCSLT